MSIIQISEISCNVNYNKGYIYDEICKFVNVKQKTHTFKNLNVYITHLVDHIKENVIKKYADLQSINVEISIFDNQNTTHLFIMSMNRALQNTMKCKHNFDREKYNIIIYITHENKIVFASAINLFDTPNRVERHPTQERQPTHELHHSLDPYQLSELELLPFCY